MEDDHVDKERQCCGGSLRTFAMTSTLAGAMDFLASSLLAFWAYSYVKTLSTIIAAEDEAHSNVLSNVKLVSLGLGLLYLAAAVGSAALFGIAGWSADRPRRLRFAVLAVFFIVFLLVAWEIGGGIMCWSGSALESVEAACSIIDDKCLSNYKKLMYYSIPIEVLGALLGAWELISCRLYYAQERKKDPSSISDTLADDDARPLVKAVKKSPSSAPAYSSDDEPVPSRRSSSSLFKKSAAPIEEHSMSKHHRRNHSSRSHSHSRSSHGHKKHGRRSEREYSEGHRSHRSSTKSRRERRAYGSRDSSSSSSDSGDGGRSRKGRSRSRSRSRSRR